MKKVFALVPVEVNLDDDGQYVAHINPTEQDFTEALEACGLVFEEWQDAIDVLFDIEDADDDDN